MSEREVFCRNGQYKQLQWEYLGGGFGRAFDSSTGYFLTCKSYGHGAVEVDIGSFLVKDAFEKLEKQSAEPATPVLDWPEEPTPEIEEAACEAADNGKFSGAYLAQIYKAMREAHAKTKQPTKGDA